MGAETAVSETDADRGLPSRLSWLAAFAHPVRLEILIHLNEREQATVGDLAGALHASGTTLRRHLGALTSSGLVEERESESGSERDGRPPAKFSLSAPIRQRVRDLLRYL